MSPAASVPSSMSGYVSAASNSVMLSPSPSTTSSSQSSGTTMAVVIALAVTVLLIGGAVLFFILRKRRGASSSRRWSHEGLATRITPFGSRAPETPRYVHTPGADMRIATRRADGVWEFGDPRAWTPSTPGGVSDIDHTPSPSSASLFSYPRSATPSSLGDYNKWSDYKGSRKAAMAYEDYEPKPDVLPPPAYVYGHPHQAEAYLSHSTEQWRA
ncbi:hypothetical protein C8J56DRAFT_339967 [Mycena floridula]|nr:hypothetical protein C8J56DRAFT_339967 [Mycena floridula]